jgi:predicted nucleic acid-binding protein
VTAYVLDTNLYIEAVRDRGKARQFASFASAHLPNLWLHAVVAQELLAGAIHREAKRRIERTIVAPFEKRDRLIVPTYRGWKRSGEIMAELVEQGVLSPGGFSRSFINDVLISASLRQLGAVLVTRNVQDFRLISMVERFRFEEPWPKAPRG